MDGEGLHPLKLSQDLGLVLLLLLYLVLLPINLFYLYQFYKLRFTVLFKARHPVLLGFVLIFEFLFVFVERPHYYFASVNLIDSHLFALAFFWSLFGLGFLYLLCLRSWLVFYDIRYATHLTGAVWKSRIEGGVSQNNWFVVHRHTYGNPRWLLSRIILPVWLAISLLFGIYTPIHGLDNFMHIMNFVVLGIPMCAMTVLWWSTPKFDDYYRVRDEMWWIFAIAIPAGLIYAVVFLAQGSEMHSIAVFVMCLDGVLIGFIFGYLMTLWPIRSFGKGWPKVDAGYDGHTQPVQDILQSTLQDEKQLEKFMSHLTREFSLDPMLFTIEAIQFIGIMKQELGDEFKEDDPSRRRMNSIDGSEVIEVADSFWWRSINIPNSVPKNHALAAPELPNFKKAMYIFEKYLSDTAECDVAIPEEIRASLDKFFDVSPSELGDLDDTSRSPAYLVGVFDRAIDCIVPLLWASIERWHDM